MSEPVDEYASLSDMFQVLKKLEKDSAAFRRQREAIITKTMPLAEHVARRYRGRGVDYEDLYQVACVGAVSAVNRFDPDNGAEFVSFAVPTIMGEVRRHFRDRGWAVKVPRRLKDLQQRLARARDELAQRTGRAPTPQELATYLGIDRELVVEATIASSNYCTLSTDAQADSNESGPRLIDTLGHLDDGLARVIDVETVRPLIAALPERERTVLTLRFFGELTQTQIAERLGISQMHVSRLLAQSLKTVRDQALDVNSHGLQASPPIRIPEQRRGRKTAAPIAAKRRTLADKKPIVLAS